MIHIDWFFNCLLIIWTIDDTRQIRKIVLSPDLSKNIACPIRPIDDSPKKHQWHMLDLAGIYKYIFLLKRSFNGIKKQKSDIEVSVRYEFTPLKSCVQVQKHLFLNTYFERQMRALINIMVLS